MAKGFIKLHRRIQDHWLYEEKRKFSKFEAWVDMLLMANHKDNKFLLGNELVEVKRGQFITSIRKLGEKWGWSNTKVSQFLDLLKSDEMIDYKKDTKKTLITIDKYSVYHDNEIEKKTPNEHEKDTNRTQKHTNKNVKNVKNDKKKYKDYVYLTDAEYEKLVNEFGQSLIDSKIEDLDNYLGSTGKVNKYKDHNRTIRSWIKKDGIQSKPQSSQSKKTPEQIEHERMLAEMGMK